MTEPKTKAAKEAGELSETTKTYLIEKYVTQRYGREPDVSSKHIAKGLAVEEDSITLYSRLKRRFFSKNEIRVHDEYINGVPDLYVPREGLDGICNAAEIIDIKSSWDIFTFFKAKASEVNTQYWWQMQGYMALTGASTARLVYCLVNTPDHLIVDEKRKLMWRMNVASDENEDYLKAAEELEKGMIYDDIPMNERCFEFIISRDDNAIANIYDKVERARIYLSQLDDKFAYVYDSKEI